MHNICTKWKQNWSGNLCVLISSSLIISAVVRCWLFLLLLSDFCQSLPGDKDTVVMTNVMPCIKEMAIDANAHVKEALAKNLMALAPIVGKEKYVCLHVFILYVYVCVFYHCVYFLDLVTNCWKEKVCMRMCLSTTLIIYYIFGFRYFVFTFALQSLHAMISILFRTMEHILPLFLILLKDDNADVRLNIISNLYSVSEVWFESD